MQETCRQLCTFDTPSQYPCARQRRHQYHALFIVILDAQGRFNLLQSGTKHRVLGFEVRVEAAMRQIQRFHQRLQSAGIYTVAAKVDGSFLDDALVSLHVMV